MIQVSAGSGATQVATRVWCSSRRMVAARCTPAGTPTATCQGLRCRVRAAWSAWAAIRLDFMARKFARPRTLPVPTGRTGVMTPTVRPGQT